ncbi:MAG: hypothetical protein E7006_02850 [Alphaproteobacteria bacterium]|nr:hypothetical protein [Alphaproteobacteria bacterium]
MNRTKQIQENIKRSKQLRNNQIKYNGFATLTMLSAIASYIASAITTEQKEHAWTIAFLATGVINQLAAFYCMGKSYQKGKQAMQALMHNTNTKAK